jgi:hypothetical protein
MYVALVIKKNKDGVKAKAAKTTIEPSKLTSCPSKPPPPVGSTDGTKKLFAPSSPSGPPPPVGSTDGTKKLFAPSSPSGPPPPVGSTDGTKKLFVPSSPSGPPPPVGSTDGTKKLFAPSSPSGPPPPVGSTDGTKKLFAPSSPSGPPPPVGSTDGTKKLFAPSSPPSPSVVDNDISLNTASGFKRPRNDSVSSDEEFERELHARELAIQLSGGEIKWDHLSEEETEYFMSMAKEKLGFN